MTTATAAAPFILLAAEDDVAVATRRVVAGAACAVGGTVMVVVRDEIPIGHKVARRQIASGQQVRKFGVPIGRATRDIAAGELVHVHNLRSDYLVNDVDHAEA
jgi:hypothetical protein